MNWDGGIKTRFGLVRVQKIFYAEYTNSMPKSLNSFLKLKS
jgi:hypothetical protein